MRMYLSSFRLGDEPGARRRLLGERTDVLVVDGATTSIG